jgi:hypothetical protein
MIRDRNEEVSDTTGDDSSNEFHYKKILKQLDLTN